MNSRASWIRIALVVTALVALLVPTVAAGKKKKRSGPNKENTPLVIGHRGASGFLPEHTLEAYRLAIKLGADYIEPDLVATKDGVLIARHEPMIGDEDPATRDSTNVADHPEFDGRLTTKTLDGFPTTAYFASDFTLAEIKTLGAKQTRGGRPTEFDGDFKVPTLQEIIRVVKNQSRTRGRKIGIYPETKHPTFHSEVLDPPLPLERRLVNVLKKNGLNRRTARVFIQSFEQSNLKLLNTLTPVRLVQLVDANDTDPVTGLPTYAAPFDRPYDWTFSNDPALLARDFGFFATNAGLDEIKTYADGIGPWKVYIIPTTGSGGGTTQTPTDLIQRAHARGLLVHTWTFRDDAFPTSYLGGPVEEYLAFYRLGIDGVFSDFPDTAFAAREIFRGP